MDFYSMAQQCAPDVHPHTMAAVVHIESSYNPYAIGVVNGRLQRQPKTLEEAVATAKNLDRLGYNFSLGISQVNKFNLARYGESYETIFDPCRNIKAGSAILKDCYTRASKKFNNDQLALRAAISCYYSNNFTRGFKPDVKGQPSYVQKVVNASDQPIKAIPVVPAIKKTQADQAKKTPEKAVEAKVSKQESKQEEVPKPQKKHRGILYERGTNSSGGK